METITLVQYTTFIRQCYRNATAQDNIAASSGGFWELKKVILNHVLVLTSFPFLQDFLTQKLNEYQHSQIDLLPTAQQFSTFLPLLKETMLDKYSLISHFPKIQTEILKEVYAFANQTSDTIDFLQTLKEYHLPNLESFTTSETALYQSLTKPTQKLKYMPAYKPNDYKDIQLSDIQQYKRETEQKMKIVAFIPKLNELLQKIENTNEIGISSQTSQQKKELLQKCQAAFSLLEIQSYIQQAENLLAKIAAEKSKAWSTLAKIAGVLGLIVGIYVMRDPIFDLVKGIFTVIAYIVGTVIIFWVLSLFSGNNNNRRQW